VNDHWPMVPLGEVLTHVQDIVDVRPDQDYPNFGIYSFGRGVFSKSPIHGGKTSATALYRAKAEQFVYSRLFAFEGAYGVVPDGFDGWYVSNEFPLLNADVDRLKPAYMHWYFRLPTTWVAIATKSTGMGNRRRRIHPEAIFAHRIPLPDRSEQDRIVAKLDAIAARLHAATTEQSAIAAETQAMLRSAFDRLIIDVPRLPMSDAAPLIRRPVHITMGGAYPELGIRSFGKGTFHKPALDYWSVGTKKLYRIEPGDLLFNNVFAWEGAIAVAQPGDTGRVGSHRFITCVPRVGIATSDFLCFYFLTPEGIERIGKASPGGAGRNRTLGLDKLAQIEVPVPPIERQLWFDHLQAKTRELHAALDESASEFEAMLPAALDRAFKGEL